MTIPDFQSIMLPLLELASDEKVHSIYDAFNQLATTFKLSNKELAELLPSGKNPTFFNRVWWARTHLKKAGLMRYPKRGHFEITARGKQVLASDPQRIDMRFLKQYPEYLEFGKTSQEGQDILQETDTLTPDEALENSYQSIRTNLAEELLTLITDSSPGFFEKLVIDLLTRMGYGGSQRDAARAVGKSGDEGIDGIIDEDRLGLDTIYIQAKKWDPSYKVSRPDIQKFVGALQGKRAKKGIFITTTQFSKDAKDYAEKIDTKVVLIDGKRLTNLMIDVGVGVTARTTYELKDIDADYFGEGSSE